MAFAGEWLKDEAIRNAIIKDPEILVQTLQTLSDPDHATTVQLFTPEQREAALDFLKAAPIPVPETGMTVSQMVTLASAASTLLRMQDGLDPASIKVQHEHVLSLLKSQPLLIDNVVAQVRGGLENAGEPGTRPAHLHSGLEELVQSGKIPDIIDVNPDDLINSLPANAVSAKLANLLNDASTGDLAKLRNDSGQMKAFLRDKVYPGVIEQGLMLTDLRKKTDSVLALLADQQLRAAAQAEHQYKVNEARGGVALASGLLRLMGGDAAKSADFVDRSGNAIIDAEQSIESLSGAFSLAASANLVGAAIKIAGLFGGGGPDVAALRQEQIVNSLSRISNQLTAISQQLGVIDKKLTFLQDSVDKLQLQDEQHYRNTTDLIAGMNDRLSAFYSESLDLAFDNEVIRIKNELLGCGDRMRRRTIPLTQSDADGLRTCLKNLKNVAINESQRVGLTLKGFAINSEAYGKVWVRERYPSTLVGAQFAVQSSATGISPNFDGAMNADVWDTAVRAYLDLLFLTPEFKDRTLVQEDLASLRLQGAKLKSRLDEFDSTVFVRSRLTKYSDLLDQVTWLKLDLLRGIANGAFGEQSSQVIPDSFLAGYDLERSLIAMRCKQKMPEFFARFHDVDEKGFLIRACAEGNENDFKKAGAGLLTMNLDARDLIFAAGALQLLDWQFEVTQRLQRQSSQSQTECDTEGGDRPRPCRRQTLYSEKGVGTIVVRYNARLHNSDKVVAHYEASVGAGDEIHATSADHNAAIAYVSNYEDVLISNLKTRLAPLKLASQDFVSRGNSWSSLTVDDGVRLSIVPVVGRHVGGLFNLGAEATVELFDLRGEIRKRAEAAREALIYKDPRALSLPIGFTEDAQHALDEIYIDVKVPLLLKYGSCANFNGAMRQLLTSIEGGTAYATTIARFGGHWNDARALEPLLRIVPHDELSVLVREPSNAWRLFDKAISDFKTNDKKYALCNFGLPSLDEGIRSIDWYLGKIGQ